jgi:hypothetical protein
MVYDKEDLLMVVSSTYPSMTEFKIALSRHAIKHEFEPIKEWHSDVSPLSINNIGLEEDNYFCNPIPDNEHVGIDEEVMYLDKTPVEAANMVIVHMDQKDKSEGEDEDNHEDGDGDGDELEIESELEDVQDFEGHEADHIPNMVYDKEDPLMVVGSTYPRMIEFKIALSHHAIKHEFEYHTEKSAPYRFRAYCSRCKEDKCPWKLYDSITDGNYSGPIVVIPQL